MIYGNKEIVRTFTRNNSPAGYVGGSIDYRVPADVYFGDTQEEADSKAEDDVKTNGQDYANTYADIIRPYGIMIRYAMSLLRTIA